MFGSGVAGGLGAEFLLYTWMAPTPTPTANARRHRYVSYGEPAEGGGCERADAGASAPSAWVRPAVMTVRRDERGGGALVWWGVILV